MPIKLHRDQFKWKNGRGHNQKPILYSQKTNNYGLGKKDHNSDEWWATAFDNQLKSLDVSSSMEGEIMVKQTATATQLSMERKSQYYIRFVPGGMLKPGINEKTKLISTETSTSAIPIFSGGECKGKKHDAEDIAKRKEKKEHKSSRQKSKKDKPKEERRQRKKLKRLVEEEIAILAARV